MFVVRVTNEQDSVLVKFGTNLARFNIKIAFDHGKTTRYNKLIYFQTNINSSYGHYAQSYWKNEHSLS